MPWTRVASGGIGTPGLTLLVRVRCGVWSEFENADLDYTVSRVIGASCLQIENGERSFKEYRFIVVAPSVGPMEKRPSVLEDERLVVILA